MSHNDLKTGYLHDDIRYFHIKDLPGRTFTAHYHSFHKLLILLQGNLSYQIEGHRYEPTPGDILLVPAGEIHHPEIGTECEYERIIFYISEDFLSLYEEQGYHIRDPFRHAGESRKHLIRFSEENRKRLFHICEELVHCPANADTSMTALYEKIKLLEILLLLMQASLENPEEVFHSATGNANIVSTLEYIHNHLQEESLSIDEICSAVYLNRSYLMHLFKEHTGYSLGQYIAEKRLFLTDSFVRDGFSIQDACIRSGFSNYAAYYHARKKQKSHKE